MKKRIIVLGFIFTALIMLAGCSSFSGVIPVVTLEGAEITVGASNMYTLIKADEAFIPKVAGGMLAPGVTLDGNSWLSENIYFSKDNKRCATAKIYNPDNSSKFVLECPIYELIVNLENTDALVNGIDFSDMDSSKVKETMQSYKLARETDKGALRYEDGEYKYFFSFDEDSGLVKEITVNIVFRKSYSEKLW